jgi:hypothetical protein
MAASTTQLRRWAEIETIRPSALVRSRPWRFPPGHGKPSLVKLGLPIEAVSAELELDERYEPWLAEVAGVAPGVPELKPPCPDGVATILGQLGCCGAAVADAVRTFPTPENDVARWWLLDRSCRRLAATMGDVDAGVGRWPDLPDHLGVAGSCFPLHLFAVALPAVRAWHAAKGVPDDISWATLVDLGRHEAVHRRATGTTGVDALFWFEYHLRGLLIEVGGLQYKTYRLGGPDQPEPWFEHEMARTHGPGFLPGDLAVSLHLPEDTAIDVLVAERSMAAARQLFDSVFPTPTRRIVTGSSWMLDDQLPGLVPSDSNIVRLAQTFHLVPGWLDGDVPILRSVFHQWGEAAGSGVARTRLQRAVLDHLEAGGHFRCRTGWREFGAD